MQSSMIQSRTDPIVEFRGAISGAGLPVPERIVADGEIHRFSTNGKASDDSGWYVLHVDGFPAGAFGCWRQGIEQKWRARKSNELTAQELQKHRKNLRAIKLRRDEEAAERHRQAALKARRIFEAAQPATGHPYLKQKGIGSHGARQRETELVLPIYDETGQVCSLQFVDGDGGKRFLPNGKVSGGHFPIGRLGDVLYICEGFATGASIREATGAAVAVAFNSGNLKPVAKAMCAKHPQLKIILAADNDVRSDGSENTGVAKASDAAVAAGGTTGRARVRGLQVRLQ